METLDELISASPLFEGLEDEYLKLIAGCGRLVRVDADKYVIQTGAPAEKFFLVRRGALALEVHGPGRGALVIDTFEAGEIVGWSWLFAPYRYQFDVRTTVPSSLVEMDGACLRGKCDGDHELGFHLMSRFASAMADALMATRLQLLDVYGDARAVR